MAVFARQGYRRLEGVLFKDGVQVMRGWETLGLIAVLLGLGGCLFDPFGAKLRQARADMGALEARVDNLEQARFGPTMTTTTVSLSESGLQEAAAPAVEFQTAAVAAQPVRSRFPLLEVSWRKALFKLGRGLINILTGWVELPKRMDETTTRSGLGVGLTFGLLRGCGYGFVRTAAGVYEIITFPFPAPPDYQPLMHPEYVFTCEPPVNKPSP